MDERLTPLDLMRTGATLGVIMIHVSANYIFVENQLSHVPFFLNQISRFSVPFFIIISGLLLLYNDINKTEFNFKYFIIRRWYKIVVPYMIWTFLYVLFFPQNKLPVILYETANNHINLYNWLNIFINNIIWGSAAPHLYFIVIILQMYLLYPILLKLFKLRENTVLIIAFIVSFYFQISDYFYDMGIVLLPQNGFKYYSISFFPWLFYFAVGMYTGSKLRKKQLNLQSLRIMLPVLWILTLFILIMDSKLSYTFTTTLKPTIILYSLISFYVFYLMCEIFQKYNSLLLKFSVWLSKQSYFIYFIHIFILNGLLSLCIQNKINLILYGSKGMVFLFISVTCIACLFAYLFSLVPYTKFLGGTYKKM